MLGVSKKSTQLHKNFKVLVAEDDPTGQYLIKIVLNKMQIENVTVVENGLEAWNLLAEESTKFDLVISDSNMPMGTGLELLQEMREQEISTPFLMITGRGLVESAVEAKMFGVTSFMTKPYSPFQLIDKIKELLKIKASPLI